MAITDAHSPFVAARQATGEKEGEAKQPASQAICLFRAPRERESTKVVTGGYRIIF